VQVSNALDTCAPVCTLFEDVVIACETTSTQVGGGRFQPGQQKSFIHPPIIPGSLLDIGVQPEVWNW
ncbi:uncharacterized protein METZ01_LOCUS407669, partial [marine metagenome]